MCVRARVVRTLQERSQNMSTVGGANSSAGAYMYIRLCTCTVLYYTGLSKKMDGIWKCYNLKSTGRIYMFGVLKCSEEFKVLDLP